MMMMIQQQQLTRHKRKTTARTIVCYIQFIRVIVAIILQCNCFISTAASSVPMDVYPLINGQSVSFSWSIDCALMGLETIAMFRIQVKLNNVTTDNDEYSMIFDRNWGDATSSSGASIGNTQQSDGYFIGQKKVTKFVHVYSELETYKTLFRATIYAPNQPLIHGIQHTTNCTIVIGNNICFTTNGNNQKMNLNDTTLFQSTDDDFTMPPKTTIPSEEPNINSKNAATEDASSSPTTGMPFSALTTCSFFVFTFWSLQ